MSNDYDDVPKHHKKAITPRRKKFGTESYSSWFKAWHIHKWYVTAWVRDQAFDTLVKSTCVFSDIKYRKVDRP